MHTQARSYTKRAFLCGSVAEVYEYRTPVFRGLTGVKNKRQSGSGHGERSLSSIARTRANLRRLVNTNAGSLNKFLTLTFAENVESVDEANYHFRLFMLRLRRLFPPLQYVAVVEFQKRGAVHYHILLNLPYTLNEQIATLWGHGFIRINRISKAYHVGRYIAKYIQKGTIDNRLWGKKAFWRSRGLAKPREILDKVIDAYFTLHYTSTKELCRFTFSGIRGEVDFSLHSLCAT